MAHAVVLMGVSGSGKTTVGELLAERLGWDFVEGDEYHAPAHVAQMEAGVPLSDDDRQPWLQQLRRLIVDRLSAGESLVLTCSALKQSYRDLMVAGDPRVLVVYLQGDAETIGSRMVERKGHFMKAPMLASQFEVLEEPEDAITVDAGNSPDEIADQAIVGLEARGVRTS